jgi:holo-[acyl-carrier protein] synthase
MIHGIGTDILKIDRIASLIAANEDDPFILKTYTQNELLLIRNRPTPLYSYATRFAGKEAVFKALGIGGNDIRLNEIEILEKENGQPCVSLLGKAKDIADRNGITQVLISLSYDTDYAIAYAIAYTNYL